MGFGIHEKFSVAAFALITALGIGIWYGKRKKTTSKNKMTLYYYPFFRSNRCTWLVAELGIKNDIELIYLDPRDPDKQKIQKYRNELHTHGTVPFLHIENETPVMESGAICMYLADIYGKLLPKPQNRKDYYNWIVYSCCTLDEILEILFKQWGETKPEDRNKNLISEAIDKFTNFADYFSKFIEGKKYICGDRFTAADCVLGYSIWWASVMREANLIENHPNLVQYLENLKQRPAFRETFQIQ